MEFSLDEIFTPRYGRHWDEQRNMPTCTVGGNMCDECFEAMIKASRDAFNVQMHRQVRKMLRIPEPVVKAPLPQEVVDKFAPYESLYELTLTTTKDDIFELLGWLRKICRSNMYMCKAFIACIELQANGMPHIHALLFSTSKYCDGTKIKKSLKFPYRYEMKRVKRPGNYYDYINKEKENPQVIDYCAKKGVEQIWEELIN